MPRPEGEQPQIEIGMSFPRQVEFTKEGAIVDFGVVATGPHAAAAVKRDLDAMYGPDVEQTPQQRKDSKAFGLAGTAWRASWQPEGPKPNWRPRPEEN